MIDLSAIPSLTTCSTNLDESCDLFETLKRREYMNAWRSPAPPHCQSFTLDTPAVTVIHSDRLGLLTDPAQKK